jgi:hypothetical protein
MSALMLAAGPAFAGDEPEAKKAPPEEKAPATGDTEMKAGTSVDRKKREVVGEADTFTAGTKVWVWSSIKGQKGATVKHVWKRGDKVLWEMTFEAKSNRYRTWSRHKVKAGEYTVEVQTEEGEVLGSTSFTVS